MNIEVFLSFSHYFDYSFMMVVECLSPYKERDHGYKYVFYPRVILLAIFFLKLFFFFFNIYPPTVSFFFLIFIYLFIFFLAVLGLRFCARAFPTCGKRGPLFIAVRGPLIIAASLVAEHRLQTRRLSSCGSRAQLLRGMWHLPGPGLEPMSPASAGGFSTTAPPGKSPRSIFNT